MFAQRLRSLRSLAVNKQIIMCKNVIKNPRVRDFICGLAGAIISFIVTFFSSCGVTKATISKPAAGTQTTITITTNNPITTKVSPDVTLTGTGSK